MKMRLCAALALALTLILLGGIAAAQPIIYQEETPQIPAMTLDGESVSLQVTMLDLLGENEEGACIIFADGQYLTVEKALLAEVSPAVDLSGLPIISDFTTLVRYNSGDAVLALQTALNELGYLEGVADGAFGTLTGNAISAFQADMGFEQTGAADPLLQMLLLSMASDAQSAVPVDPKTTYAAILDSVNVDMNAIFESGLPFNYDDISGIGMIGNAGIEYDASGAADIDQHVFTVQIGFYVHDNENNSTDIDPAIILDCLCVRRPMMKEIIIKSGTTRVTYEVSELSSSLSGAKSIERAVVILDDDAADLLAGVAEAGEMKIRVVGKYESYDIIYPEENLEEVALTGRVALTLR